MLSSSSLSSSIIIRTRRKEMNYHRRHQPVRRMATFSQQHATSCCYLLLILLHIHTLLLLASGHQASPSRSISDNQTAVEARREFNRRASSSHSTSLLGKFIRCVISNDYRLFFYVLYKYSCCSASVVGVLFAH